MPRSAQLVSHERPLGRARQTMGGDALRFALAAAATQPSCMQPFARVRGQPVPTQRPPQLPRPARPPNRRPHPFSQPAPRPLSTLCCARPDYHPPCAPSHDTATHTRTIDPIFPGPRSSGLALPPNEQTPGGRGRPSTGGFRPRGRYVRCRTRCRSQREMARPWGYAARQRPGWSGWCIGNRMAGGVGRRDGAAGQGGLLSVGAVPAGEARPSNDARRDL